MTESETNEPSPDDIGPEVRRAVGRIYRRVRSEMHDEQLGDTAVSVLAYLVKHGPQTPGLLSELERVTPPAMNQTINILQTEGLVTRAPDPSDGRKVLVAATDQGITRAAELRTAKHVWLNSRLDQLSPAERRVLVEAARILNEIAGS
ncbi:MarR family winged helix-turn-helix transcriptional regulator [Subtercola lobariae]|uniref:MarR family transcriptional regulator n=1 Tax=Subtercola lobariae TaxID=1588641 RepID=A0A917B2P1_9MICO|nr:MarR family transcriptional regulator [Subtercola lobariae]GGF15830.1 MarR family transcriptional regulator [Subtercola lobariae]